MRSLRKESIMSESNLTKCKKCGELKERILVGRFSDKAKDKKYLGTDGLTWNGLTCGPCHKTLMQDKMKELRHKRKQNLK